MSKRKRAAKRPARNKNAAGPSGSLGTRGVEQALRLAAEAQRAGQLAHAEKKYTEVIAARPREARAWFGSGQLKVNRGERSAGLAQLRRAVELDSRSFGYRAVLAEALLAGTEQNAGLEALARAEEAVELAPQQPLPRQVHARCLERFNRFPQALAAIKKAHQLQPGDLPTQTILARLYRRTGQLNEAKELLLKLGKRGSTSPWQWQKIIWHELGMTLDQLGEYEQAAAAFIRYSEIMQASTAARAIDRESAYRGLELLQASLSEGDLKAGWRDNLNPADIGSPAPIFLVGFPRSGTTLTEQILAAHPQVETSDEYPFIAETAAVAAELLGGHPLQARAALTPALAKQLREYYWERVQARTGLEIASGAGVFLDKLPLNIVNLGFINLLFPEAKILVALRDPRDVCLSCFLQDFELNDSMIHFLTLEDTVRFYAAVFDYFLRLREQLSLQLSTFRYEDTVTDLKHAAQHLLAKLELPWTDAVLRFHEQAQKRFISTPSFAAVTQPVHRGAIGRWENYRALLGPHLPQLVPYLQAFNYPDK